MFVKNSIIICFSNNIRKYDSIILFTLLSFLLLLICASKANEEGKHIYSAVIFRHGDRTPIKMYPTSKYNNESYWPVGWGQLTQDGKQRAYKIGLWLKQRLNKLLEQYNYDIKKVYTITSDFDRTIMTSQCILTALFNAADNETIDPTVGKWQPIPVRTLSAAEDNMIYFTKPCPEYQRQIEKLPEQPEVKKLLEQTDTLINYLLDKTGCKPAKNRFDDFLHLLTVKEAIDSERTFNYTIPDWVPEIERNLSDVSHYPFLFYTFTKTQKLLRAGPLLQDILASMKDKIKNNENAHALKLYGAHDFVIMGIMNAIKSDEKFKRIPYFVATLLFDLYEYEHKYGDDKYVIKIFFKNSTESDEEIVNLADCPNPCTVKKFETNYAEILPTHWELDCHLTAALIPALGFLEKMLSNWLPLFAIGGTGTALALYFGFFKRSENRIITNILNILSRSSRQTSSSPPTSA